MTARQGATLPVHAIRAGVCKQGVEIDQRQPHIQRVVTTHHRVAELERGDCELDRHLRSRRRPEHGLTLEQDLPPRIQTRDGRQEVVKHHLLVMKDRLPPRGFEDRTSTQCVIRTDASTEEIVQLEKRDMQLRDQQILIIAVVRNARSAVFIAGQIMNRDVGIGSRRARPIELHQSGAPLDCNCRIVESFAVDVLEVQHRRAHLSQLAGLADGALSRIEAAQVVRDELAEIHIAGRDTRRGEDHTRHCACESVDRIRWIARRGNIEERKAPARAALDAASEIVIHWLHSFAQFRGFVLRPSIRERSVADRSGHLRTCAVEMSYLRAGSSRTLLPQSVQAFTQSA